MYGKGEKKGSEGGRERERGRGRVIKWENERGREVKGRRERVMNGGNETY